MVIPTSDPPPRTPAIPDDVQVGDLIQTRKPHPCGSDRWQVYRIGADIGLRCLGCGRLVMLPFRQFARAMKPIKPSLPPSGNA
jgi:hypothetical protein